MDGKLLARSGAAAFVGIAVAMTLVQLHEEPARRERRTPTSVVADKDPLPARLEACARIGEAALTTPDCLAAWAEKRRRFFDVDHPDAYAEIARPNPPSSAEPPAMPDPGSE